MPVGLKEVLLVASLIYYGNSPRWNGFQALPEPRLIPQFVDTTAYDVMQFFPEQFLPVVTLEAAVTRIHDLCDIDAAPQLMVDAAYVQLDSACDDAAYVEVDLLTVDAAFVRALEDMCAMFDRETIDTANMCEKASQLLTHVDTPLDTIDVANMREKASQPLTHVDTTTLDTAPSGGEVELADVRQAEAPQAEARYTPPIPERPSRLSHPSIPLQRAPLTRHDPPGLAPYPACGPPGCSASLADQSDDPVWKL